MSHYCGRTTAHGPHAEQAGRCQGAAEDLVPTLATAKGHGVGTDGPDQLVYFGICSPAQRLSVGRVVSVRREGRAVTIEETRDSGLTSTLATLSPTSKIWAAPVPQPAPYERSCVNGAHAEATHVVAFSDGTTEDCCDRHAAMYHVGQSFPVRGGREITAVSVEPIGCASCYRPATHVVTFSSPDPTIDGRRERVCEAHIVMYRVGSVFCGFPERTMGGVTYPATPEFTVVSVEPVGELDLGFMKEDSPLTLPPQLDAIEYDLPLAPVDAAELLRRWTPATSEPEVGRKARWPKASLSGLMTVDGQVRRFDTREVDAVAVKLWMASISEAVHWAARRTAWYQAERQMDYETAHRHALADWKARQKLDGVRRHWISLAADLEAGLSGASPELAASLAEAGWDGVERVLRELLAEGRRVAAVRHVMRTTGLRLREARDWLDSYIRWSGAPVSRGVVPV